MSYRILYGKRNAENWLLRYGWIVCLCLSFLLAVRYLSIAGVVDSAVNQYQKFVISMETVACQLRNGQSLQAVFGGIWKEFLVNEIH